MWHPQELTHAVATALADQERQLCAEQAYQGLDAMTELQLHPLIAHGFTATGQGVFREQPYPSDTGPIPADRERCDLVLLENSQTRLIDPVLKNRSFDLAKDTLFADVLDEAEPSHLDALPEDAYWMEVKVVAQHSYVSGVPSPNRSYASSLIAAIRHDLIKLAADEHIIHAGVLIILFTEDSSTAEHDLMAAIHRCIDRNTPVGSPAMEHIPIADRISNTNCTIALVRMRR